MRFIKYVLAAVLVLLAQLPLATAASAKWLRADTRHFVIYSSGSGTELELFGSNLERFDTLLRLKFNIIDDENPNKLVVYFLAGQESVGQLVKNAAGFYAPDSEGTYAVANRDRKLNKTDLSGMEVLFHEYAHHFMFRHFSYPYPAWYVEGFAEYYATAEFKKDGTWALGKPPYYRAYGLVLGAPMAINKILFGEPNKRDAEQADIYYGRAWLLVHMLTTKPEFKGKLPAYFAAIRSGKSEQEAAALVFGDLRAFDQALDRYRDNKLTFWSSKVPLGVDTGMTVSELDPVASQLLVLRLNRMGGRDPTKTRAALRALVKAEPKRADVWYELAMSERETLKDASKADQALAEQQAETSVDQALAADPKHVRANVLKADILMRRLRDASDAVPAHWIKPRTYLVTANTGALNDPLVLLAWYDSFALQGRPPTKIAQDALARAFELQPELPELRIKFAFDLAQQGRFDEAIHLVEFLAHDPHDSETGTKLLKLLQDMKAQDAATAKTAL